MAAFVTGDLHGGLDIQKLRDWEADEKHVVLHDNIVALGAGSDSWQRTAFTSTSLRNCLPIFRQAAKPSSGEGHNLPHITKKSGPSWVPTRQFMVAGAGFEPATFGL